MSWDGSLWGRLAGSNVYCADTDRVDLCSKAEPQEQRGLTSYTIASRLQKQKAKLNPHMAARDFYWLLHFPSAMWPFSCFNSLSFISLLCHPLPLSCCQNTTCVFLFWPPLSCYNPSNTGADLHWREWFKDLSTQGTNCICHLFIDLVNFNFVGLFLWLLNLEKLYFVLPYISLEGW
jgi:hypothetical protein